MNNNYKIADHALLLQVKTLFGRWRVPLEHHSSKGPVSGDKLYDIVINCIKFCLRVGLKLKVIACDQGTPNQKLFNILGITPEEPFFDIGDYNHLKILKLSYKEINLFRWRKNLCCIRLPSSLQKYSYSSFR